MIGVARGHEFGDNDFLTDLYEGWDFNEGSGSTTQGVLGNYSGSFLNGATFNDTYALDGYSSYFSSTSGPPGSDDRIKIEGGKSAWKWMHGAENTSSFAWSINFWFKPINLNKTGTSNGLYYWGGTSGTGGRGVLYWLENRQSIGRTRRLACVIASNNPTPGNVVVLYTNNTYPNDTDWHNVGITYDQSLSTGNCKGYIDGELVDTANKSAITPDVNDPIYDMHIGGYEQYDDYCSYGWQDLHYIWKDRVLTPEEIRVLYNNGYGFRFKYFK